MRIVISRVLADPGIESITIDEPINSQIMAFNIGCGNAKPKDFNNFKEPLWWVIRWLAFNQRKKFPRITQQLENLKKLAEIDSKKFIYPSFYVEQMFVDPQESFEGILEIFINMDYTKARELIRSERTSRDSIRFVMHDVMKWNLKLQDLKQKANELIKWLLMKN